MLSKRLIPVCLFAATICSATVRAQQMVPFHGTWTGETISATFGHFPPIVDIVAAGDGQFSHSGRSTMVSPHTTDIFTGETIGEQIFTAANGDTLTAFCEGFPVAAPDGSTVDGTLDCEITGGTGRFQGATGSDTFTFHSDIIPEALPDVRYATVAAISGVISSVGSSK